MSELLQFSDSKVLPIRDTLDGGPSESMVHRFGFQVGRYQFVLAKSLSTEILIKPTIYHIPNCPSWVVGMVNLRSNILPVIDLSVSLRTQGINNTGEFVLIVDKGRESLAILVESLPKLLKDPVSAEKVSASEYVAQEFVQPGVMVGGDVWDELDIKKLVKEQKVSVVT